MEKNILVPHDFTEVGDFALEHAYMLGKATGAKINLLHVISRNSKYNEAFAKLDDIAKKFKEKHDVEIVPKVLKGNLFKTINIYGLEIDAYIAVMGTHGVKSVKKAMKVVRKFTKMPFILVQSPVMNQEYKKVVVTLSHDPKTRIFFNWIKYINNLFKCEVHIIYHEEKDGFRAKSLYNNVKFAKNFLDQELIEYEIKILPTSKRFSDEVYSHSKDIDADIVLVMADRYRKFARDIRNSSNLEYFKKLPIMCVNPRTDIFKLGSFS